MQIKTPVTFFIFNRPDTTRQVFNVIREAQPKTLIVVADGPRQSKEGEREKCEETRKIIESVDWQCNLIKLYSDINYGCKKRVSSGIDWVFDHFEEAIFLEDDCLPHISFFQFCEELLEYYRYNVEVTNICGINIQFGKNNNEYSYYFSHLVHVWGWASWRRAWKHYDVEMRNWTTVKSQNLLEKYFNNQRSKKFWYQEFDKTFNGEIDTWDYQWVFACWIKNGLNVIPNVNLISNIGFGKGGVHTEDAFNELSNIPVKAMRFPLKHPPKINRNIKADNFTQDHHFSLSIPYRIRRKLKKIFLGRYI